MGAVRFGFMLWEGFTEKVTFVLGFKVNSQLVDKKYKGILGRQHSVC